MSNKGMKEVIDVERDEQNVGYFEYMQELKEQIPVDQYIVTPRTSILALASMAGVSVVAFVLYAFTMFRFFSFTVAIVYGLLFLGFAKVFYDRVLYPEENLADWEGGDQ